MAYLDFISAVHKKTTRDYLGRVNEFPKAEAAKLELEKQAEIEAITFDELVQHGKDSGCPIVSGMPWSFKYKGHAITHENDECYIIPTLEGNHHFTPIDMLITGVKGEIYPCKKDIFEMTYEAV